jgi:hypothetical protein
MFRIEGDAIHWANLLALGFIKVTDTLGALVGVDDVNLVTLGDGTIRAFRLADVAIDALVGNHQGHFA